MNRRQLLSYIGVGGLSIGGFAAYQNGIFESFFTQATGGGGSDDPARREFGATTTGISAIEWQDDGKLLVEAKEDATWQGIVVETQQQDWIATGNRNPTDESITLAPLSGGEESVLPEDHKLRIVDRELNSFEVQEINWVETVTLDFAAELELDSTYNIDGEQLELTVENTGPCAIRGNKLEISTDSTDATVNIGGAVKPGTEETLTVENPWPDGEDACSTEGTDYSGDVVFFPAVDAELSYTIELPEDKSCTTIGL
jgi:hypothetical protein